MPVTDPRLKEMNSARWVLAHQMQIEKDRREMRKMARFFGTDLASFSEIEEEPNAAPQVIPLAAILNPEAYGKMTERYATGQETSIDEEEFERQARMLEEAGALTEIDSIVDAAQGKLAEKKQQKKEEKDSVVLTDPIDLRKADELAAKAAAQGRRRRPKIVR